jgi:hypothetical protein
VWSFATAGWVTPEDPRRERGIRRLLRVLVPPRGRTPLRPLTGLPARGSPPARLVQRDPAGRSPTWRGASPTCSPGASTSRTGRGWGRW